MIAVPFHLKCPGFDTLGIIRLSRSRRNKTKTVVHISAGADYEHVIDFDVAGEDISCEYFIATWLEQYGYLEEITGVEMLTRVLPENMSNEYFVKDLLNGQGSLRIW